MRPILTYLVCQQLVAVHCLLAWQPSLSFVVLQDAGSVHGASAAVVSEAVESVDHPEEYQAVAVVVYQWLGIYPMVSVRCSTGAPQQDLM